MEKTVELPLFHVKIMPFYHFVVFEWKAPIDSEQLTLTITISINNVREMIVGRTSNNSQLR